MILTKSEVVCAGQKSKVPHRANNPIFADVGFLRWSLRDSPQLACSLCPNAKIVITIVTPYDGSHILTKNKYYLPTYDLDCTCEKPRAIVVALLFVLRPVRANPLRRTGSSLITRWLLEIKENKSYWVPTCEVSVQHAYYLSRGGTHI